LRKEIRERLFKYISGIISNKGHKPLAINGHTNHVHIFVSLKPDISVSNLVKGIKQNSTNFVKEKGLIKHKFNWQTGYGAFTYSRSQINSVINYIKNQEKHHKTKTFEEEYTEFMKKFGVDYEERYLFD